MQHMMPVTESKKLRPPDLDHHTKVVTDTKTAPHLQMEYH